MTRPLGDRRVWRLAVAASLLMGGQFAVLTALPLLATSTGRMSQDTIGRWTALIYVLSILTRIAVGARSDRSGRRIGPIRRLAVASASMLVAAATLAAALPGLAVPAVLAAALILLTWNGLAFAAAGELAAPGRTGEAVAVLTTTLYTAGAVAPALTGLTAERTSWAFALALTATAPTAAALLLRPLTSAEPAVHSPTTQKKENRT